MSDYDVEANDWKIEYNEKMVGLGSPSGYPDTLNRFPSRIWNLLRDKFMFADGSPKLHFHSFLYHTATETTTSHDWTVIREKGFNITDEKALIFFQWATEFEGWRDPTTGQAMLGAVRWKVDGIVQLAYDVLITGNFGTDLASGAWVSPILSAQLIGAGAHTLSLEWRVSSGGSTMGAPAGTFGMDEDLCLNVIIFENNTLFT